jgi:hypothetical protein
MEAECPLPVHHGSAASSREMPHGPQIVPRPVGLSDTRAHAALANQSASSQLESDVRFEDAADQGNRSFTGKLDTIVQDCVLVNFGGRRICPKPGILASAFVVIPFDGTGAFAGITL